MKMFIHSVFGILDCEPMQLQDIQKSVSEHQEELQAEEKINSAVTATNKEESKVASESCCEPLHPDPDGAVDIDESSEI